MINPIDTAGSLTYGKGDAKHSNGRLFRFLTGSPYRIDKQYSVGLRAVTVRAIRAEGGIHTQTVTAKNCSNPSKESLQPFFRNKKITGSVLADPSVFTSFKQFFWLTHPKLHTAFSGLTQWPTFVKCGASTHTAAVPSGILTRFSILLWCCYHIHKHLNGIFTCTVSIHD